MCAACCYAWRVQRSETPAFGRIPDNATHFSVRRRGEHAWDWCTFPNEERVAQHEFPISDLSIALVRKRWGAGTYRVMFLSVVRGVRHVYGNGKIFELTALQRGGIRNTPPRDAPARDLERQPPPSVQTAEHTDMVRALLRAGEGSKSAAELFQALAIPTGIGLGNLFTFQEQTHDRLAALEQRLAAIEARLGTGLPAKPAPPEDDPLSRILCKLEAIEGRLPPPRKGSPGLGRR